MLAGMYSICVAFRIGEIYGGTRFVFLEWCIYAP